MYSKVFGLHRAFWSMIDSGVAEDIMAEAWDICRAETPICGALYGDIQAMKVEELISFFIENKRTVRATRPDAREQHKIKIGYLPQFAEYRHIKIIESPLPFLTKNGFR